MCVSQKIKKRPIKTVPIVCMSVPIAKGEGTWERNCWSLSVTLRIYGFRYFATGFSVLWVSSSAAWRYAKQTCFESPGFTSFSVITGDGRGLYGPFFF